jgi:hypothetical protein
VRRKGAVPGESDQQGGFDLQAGTGVEIMTVLVAQLGAGRRIRIPAGEPGQTVGDDFP